MERGSDKHNPMLDEELEHETRSLQQGAPLESRVEEHREQEPAADGEPVPDSRLVGGRATAASLDLDEADARAELARFLSPSVFPAGREELEASARDNGATEPVLAALDTLPSGRTYENVQAVWRELGGNTERRL